MIEPKNLWSINSDKLSLAYLEHSESIKGRVRFELVTRMIIENLPPQARTVVDIGGGQGVQAIKLAKEGLKVTLVEPDPIMLKEARDNIFKESEIIRSNIQFVNLDWAEFLVNNKDMYDVVCCHSVIMYEPRFESLLSSLCSLIAPNGIVSVLSVNPKGMGVRNFLNKGANAMVDFLSKRERGIDFDFTYKQYSRIRVMNELEANGLCLLNWYGIGFYSEMYSIGHTDCSFEDLIEIEYLVSKSDDHKELSYLFHLIYDKTEVTNCI